MGWQCYQAVVVTADPNLGTFPFRVRNFSRKVFDILSLNRIEIELMVICGKALKEKSISKLGSSSTPECHFKCIKVPIIQIWSRISGHHCQFLKRSITEMNMLICYDLCPITIYYTIAKSTLSKIMTQKDNVKLKKKSLRPV